MGFRQGKETTGQLTGGDHQLIHGGLNLVRGNAVFRFPLGGVFLQGAVISTLGEKLLQLCTPFLQVGLAYGSAVRVQEKPHLVGQLGELAFAEGTEAVQGEACLQIIQPAVRFRQREGLLGQFGQRGMRLGIIFKLSYLFPAHVDNHQAVHFVLGIAQAAVQGVDTQGNGGQFFPKTQAFITQTSHKLRILSFIKITGSIVLFAGYTGIRRRSP